ncbi:MAG TPA: glycosyltransferase family 4 protein [Gaiellaceae bacterium]|nr:glycosyltransferase family 4 protein [Gaiellaceae bacterium]
MGNELAGRPSVALVAHKLNETGGMERAFYELVLAIHRDYRVSVFSLETAPDLQPLVEWNRIRVPRRPIPLMFVLFYALAGIRLARGRFDLVHTMGAIVPNRADVATVQFCQAGFRERTRAFASQGAPLLRRLNTAVFRVLALAAERWSYRLGRVHVLAAVSRGVERELERHYAGVPVALTPNGVDPNRFRPDATTRRSLRSDEGVRDGTAVALFVGGDWDRKGLAIIVTALAAARHAARVDLALWVVGSGDERRFRRLAAVEGVPNAVRFFGPRRDVERFYRAADVFVLASEYETFSLAAHEAAAAGVPIVATRVSGVEDLIGNDEAGILVERTTRSFADALARLACDPALRRRLGDEGARRARDRTWRQSTQSVLDVYRNVRARASANRDVVPG